MTPIQYFDKRNLESLANSVASHLEEELAGSCAAHRQASPLLLQECQDLADACQDISLGLSYFWSMAIALYVSGRLRSRPVYAIDRQSGRWEDFAYVLDFALRQDQITKRNLRKYVVSRS